MRITQEADYSMRVVLYLTKLGYEQKVDAATIAEHEMLPLRFLLKLLRKLIKSGIVKSYRGVKGGYALNKPPKDINLREVIEAIDGPICINRCITDSAYCNAKRTGICEIHNELSRIREDLVKKLEEVNFEDLKNKSKK
ncbi:RrF2 family transcriptional regulator [Clostridium felsineum]|uniref:HTH-type transcriptional regulator n=1 Tax=Clostridium felsineum TaxID=36839 RepID=A0A1S8L3K4_9CLOT|nr:Rrf2 family transcriptional regulator [Clostridium felsineum]MCR3758968.1 Rrf2 family transcriptional regulator [Clostridium felsineum]URZ02673.1 Putative HTH-type transcriptional regulator [Clostridium felsineum]URZ09004.1 Putative HTH-type transcriptional regulator [Clostridium felsineum]URZ09632.1 Putative HTH-type transcriptional regulator [Clostridium felsineum]URZ14026.1 Putative HTH-type transcriptional regulator [Clostridium felsineum DSM 794]